jgi:hypothetical protein
VGYNHGAVLGVVCSAPFTLLHSVGTTTSLMLNHNPLHLALLIPLSLIMYCTSLLKAGGYMLDSSFLGKR